MRAEGSGCLAVTDDSGFYALPAPNGPLEIRATFIGFRMVHDSILSESGPDELNFTFGPSIDRMYDWSRLSVRPPTPADATGTAGCYWIGRSGAWPEVIELRPDGSVPELERYVGMRVYGVPPDYEGDRTVRGSWTFDSESQQVSVGVGIGRYMTPMFELDFSEGDLSAIPAVLHHLSDALIIPSTFDSFVTRVECSHRPSSSQLGFAADAIIG